ncbi:MAG: ATP-dependent RecD-like DNA helicase [Tissierellia bacterium]|nr:ATP-dependent RecD-like DNA helicase [Tissierellia bacterium]
MDIDAVVKNIIFENENNQYRVINLDTEDGEIVAVGTIPKIYPGETVHITGDMVYHPVHGEQIQVEEIRKGGFDSVIAMMRYMEAVLPHIGKKTSKAITDVFGDKTLDILMEDPDRLLEVPGIGKKRLEKIKKKLNEESDNTKNYIYLQKLGVSMKQAKKILDEYGDRCKDIIESNPYQLIEDIRGIGFKIADSIAMRQKIEMDSFFRIKAGVRYTLEDESQRNGHVYLPKEELIQKVAKLLQLSEGKIEESLGRLIIDNTLILDEKEEMEICYHPLLYETEEKVAARFARIIEAEVDLYIDQERAIEKIIKNSEIPLGEEQIEAIRASFEEKILIITGGPGTGKTTIIKEIVESYRNEGLDVTLCAPTGRAAKRMEESCDHEAKTIHRLLGYKPLDGDQMFFEKDFDDPLLTDMIICDEASMIDMFLMKSFLDAVPDETRMVFVGDVDQLPSVGAGHVLGDMMESKMIKTIELKTIYRQTEDSNITINAHLINQGKMPRVNEKGKDFFFIHCENNQEIHKKLLQLVANRLPNYYQLDPLEDIQVLSPMKRTEIGTIALNEALQEVLNPKTPDKEEIVSGERIFRDRDKVMQIQNNYEKEFEYEDHRKEMGVYNGDMGRITALDEGDEKMEIIFDEGKKGKYTKNELFQIELSYCITIHKAQGSEFPVVVIPVGFGPYLLMTRNLIYTAITRAKKLVVLVGMEKALYQMIKNDFVLHRNTKLSDRIREFVETYRGLIRD